MGVNLRPSIARRSTFGVVLGKRETFAKILEWRFHAALFLACDGRLLQIELALDASACLVGNFPLLQQPVDVFALGGNQFRPEIRRREGSFDPV